MIEGKLFNQHELDSLKKITKSFKIENFSILTDGGFEKIEKLHETIPYEVYHLKLDDGYELKCADNHIVFGINFKEIFVKDLKVGDKVVISHYANPTKNFNEVNYSNLREVLEVTNLGYEEVMYDFELPEKSDKRYYTNGILSHNTSIVEGLAQLIVSGNTPRPLMNKKIYILDIASIVAGTKYRGQFEERMKAILEETKNNPDIILFIDELHTIVGAGNASGSLDASNIFKPALARGEIQIIGATTLDEYREHIEKDGALTRRFQQVMVEEPTTDETKIILNNIKEKYEKHHNVIYTNEAIEECVKLSNRYIMDRAMPDKAIDVMDESGAVTNVSIEKPSNIKKLEKAKIDLIEKKKDVIKKQKYEEAAKLRDDEKKIDYELSLAIEKWNKKLNNEPKIVDVDIVAQVVSDMTGIPVTKISTQETKKLITMDKDLMGKVIGQDNAVSKVVKAIKRNRIGIKDKTKPIGTFIFLGQTGVGKCICGDTEITVRNKVTGEVKTINIKNIVPDTN